MVLYKDGASKYYDPTIKKERTRAGNIKKRKRRKSKRTTKTWLQSDTFAGICKYLYIRKNWTIKRISENLEVGQTTVTKVLNKHQYINTRENMSNKRGSLKYDPERGIKWRKHFQNSHTFVDSL